MGVPIIQPSDNPSPVPTPPATPPTGSDSDGEWPFIDEPEPEQEPAGNSGVGSPVVHPNGNSRPATATPSTPPPADDDVELPFAVSELAEDATESVMSSPVVQPSGSPAPATASSSTPPPSTPPPAADTAYEWPFAVPGPAQVADAAATEATATGGVRAVGQEELYQLHVGGHGDQL